MNKMRNKITRIDGIVFRSMREAARFRDLRRLECAGVITALEVGPTYKLLPEVKTPSGAKLRRITYTPDFCYSDDKGFHCEDVKGQRSGTPYTLFRAKQRLMYEIHGIEVVEV